ncbi:MAG TPA: helix-hairpin-helix domain-containing protein [Candidatus Blautia avistercoris]|nr:helix-hairpin-helix domain-containing protein [Candidatus Blautia avistercoris]
MKLKKKLLLLLLGYVLFVEGCSDTEAEIFTEEEISAEQPEELTQEVSPVPGQTPAVTPVQTIYVDVGGAVNKPGVYQLKSGARIYEAIEKAGGFTPEAEPESINQAQMAQDGEQILVLTKEEFQAQGVPQTQAAGQSPAQGQEGKVNINTADETQLQTLSGIGQSRAEAIIEYREKNGGFSSVEEIMNVDGIKEGIFEKIKDEIVVG